MESNEFAYYKTPIGIAKIVGNKNGINAVSIIEDEIKTSIEIPKYLDEYFNGTRTAFNLKLNPQGTGFQQRVWKELLNIPHGKTRSYLEQSKN